MVEKIKQALERAYKERSGKSRTAGSGDDGSPRLDIFGDWSETDVLEKAIHAKISTKHLALNRIVTFDNTDASVESYRLLRTQLIQKIKSNNLRSIGISSPNENEGKTLTSINLAISLAKTADINTILIDGDITRPSLHRVLGIESKAGLVDLLKEEASLSDVLLKLDVGNLWLVPGCLNELSLLDHINPVRIEELLKILTSSKKNLVIVDLPPVLSKDDTLAIAACLDGVILVAEEGKTKTEEVARSAELLKQGNLIGTVMNKYSRHQSTYY